MDIRQCRRCGKIFAYVSAPICADCTDEIDRMFIKVRDYLYEHPDAKIEEISEKTEVPEKQILEFLRSERLSLRDASGMLLCEQCGKPITGGRYCDDCKAHLGKALSGRTQPPAPKQNDPQKKETKPKQGGKTHLDLRR